MNNNKQLRVQISVCEDYIGRKVSCSDLVITIRRGIIGLRISEQIIDLYIFMGELMYLKGWKYEGTKISDKLHEQMLDIIAVLNDEKQVAGRKWPALQKDISDKLGIATGQVRTIKRMMEAFGILKEGSLNSYKIPNAKDIYAENGRTLVELLETEKLMRENQEANDEELMKEIKSIYRLYYQQVLVNYIYNEDGKIFHPLRAALKALKKYEYLNYWEWYLLNTVIRSDDNLEEEAELDRLITAYRAGQIKFKSGDIIENKLSHSYVLGNFEYAGFVCVSGSKESIRIILNKDAREIIDEITKEESF